MEEKTPPQQLTSNFDDSKTKSSNERPNGADAERTSKRLKTEEEINEASNNNNILHHDSITSFIVGHTLQKCTHSLFDGFNLFAGTLNEQGSSYLVNMHFGAGGSLHTNDSGSTTTNNYTHMIRQNMPYLSCLLLT